MAEGKKSFVLYCDLIHTVEQMSDKDAGQLLKHILLYVNDQEPQTKNKAVILVFEPIKRQMKRDLVKWEEKKKGLSDRGKEGGIKSGEARRQKAEEAKRSQTKPNEANASKNEANEAVNVTVTVTDTVNVTESEKEKKPHADFPDQNFMIDPKELNGSSHIGRIGMNLKIPAEKMNEYLKSFLEDRENDQRKYKGMPGLLSHFTEHCQTKHNGKAWKGAQQPNKTNKTNKLISGKPL